MSPFLKKMPYNIKENDELFCLVGPNRCFFATKQNRFNIVNRYICSRAKLFGLIVIMFVSPDKCMSFVC